MIKIYTSPFCSSCKKVKNYFKEKGIPVKNIDIIAGDLTVEDIYEILKKSDYGTEEIVSSRSKIFKEKRPDFNSMSVKQLAEFIVANPTILRRPIIVDDRKIQVGYDPDELTAFRPIIKQIIIENRANCPLNKVCKHMPYPEETKQLCEDKKEFKKPQIQLVKQPS